MFAVPVTTHEVDTNPVKVSNPIDSRSATLAVGAFSRCCQCIYVQINSTMTCNTLAVVAIKLAVGLCGPLDDSDLKALNPPDRWQPNLTFLMGFRLEGPMCSGANRLGWIPAITPGQRPSSPTWATPLPHAPPRGSGHGGTVPPSARAWDPATSLTRGHVADRHRRPNDDVAHVGSTPPHLDPLSRPGQGLAADSCRGGSGVGGTRVN